MGLRTKNIGKAKGAGSPSAALDLLNFGGNDGLIDGVRRYGHKSAR